EKLRKNLNLFEPKSYLNEQRKIVWPKNADASKLVVRIQDDDDPMPPKGRDRLVMDEIRVLKEWINAGALLPAQAVAQGNDAPAPPAAEGQQLAQEAKNVLTKYCFDCHGKDPANAEADLNLFDPEQLHNPERKCVIPGKPADSKLITRIRSPRKPMP